MGNACQALIKTSLRASSYSHSKPFRVPEKINHQSLKKLREPTFRLE